MATADNNEWDMFAAVHRALQGGEQLVRITQHVPLYQAEDGSQGYATDEAGERYELSREFSSVLQLCIREFKISWSMEREDGFTRRWLFGPGVATACVAPEPEPGVTVINLLELDPDDPETHRIFDQVQQSLDAQREEDNEGDEWKSLLTPDE